MEKTCFRIFAISMLSFILFTLLSDMSIEIADKESDDLFKYQNKEEKTLPEKPCGHIFFNRYCIDCREYRDKYEY